MPSDNLSFRTPEALMEQIRRRDPKGVKNPGAIAKREVERWYRLLDDAMAEVKITPVESVVLISYVGKFDGKSIGIDLHKTLTSTAFWLSEEFRPAGDSLTAKVAKWSQAAQCAAWDAAERYEALVQRDRGPLIVTFGMALHRVGLHTYDLSPDELAVVERMRAAPADFLAGVYLRALKESE